jgi:hypothetical protein
MLPFLNSSTYEPMRFHRAGHLSLDTIVAGRILRDVFNHLHLLVRDAAQAIALVEADALAIVKVHVKHTRGI